MYSLVLIFSLISHYSFFEPSAFLKYIQKNKIYKKDQVYVVLSSHTCGSCQEATIEALKKSACENLLVITGDPLAYKEIKTAGLRVYLDESFGFDYLPYNFTYTSVVKIVREELEIETYGPFSIRNMLNEPINFCS